MIRKEDFIASAERSAANLSDLPVTSALFRYLAAELKKGDPAWWKRTLKAWEQRQFVAWTEAVNLFLTCVHFEALDDAENPLVPYFPSCGGTAEADPSPAFAKFLADPPSSFFEHLKSGERRYYSEGAGSMWRFAAGLYFQPRGLPYYLVEVNTGAGINLLADVLAPDPKFDSELVAARIGFDCAPLLIDDIKHLRWLTAAVFPDQAPAIASLDRAIATLRKSRERDAAMVQLVTCATNLAPKYIAKNIPSDDPEVGLLLYNYLTTSRMADTDYQAFAAEMLAVIRPWGDRALWFEVETVRGELYSTTVQYRLHRVVGGLLASHEMGRADFAARKDLYDAQGTLKFLGLSKPAQSE
ncbi:MAG: DUF2332 family protein [Elusimicrobia bacterium]|nr:DUF2332 family protein [Elusimicrobiota bacterium]